jgi:lysophospholipase L1-like esterase
MSMARIGRMRVLTIGAVAMALVACGPEVPNLDSPGTTIVCFGDSITEGVGGDGVTYPQLLGERLGVEVHNAGVGGDTAEEALGRLEQVLALDPWLVIVELGGNDQLRRMPIARTEEALRAILERLLQARVVPVLVEVRVPIIGGRHAELYERLADDYDVPLVADVLADVLVDRALKSDEIHPNAAGYRLLAAAVAETVEPLVTARAGGR